jgi:hypothetical protein
MIVIHTMIYAAGYTLAFCMLRIEQEAAREVYTKGDRAGTICFSLLSWVGVLVLLTSAWVREIRRTGYWNRPVKEKRLEKEIKIAPIKDDDDDE